MNKQGWKGKYLSNAIYSSYHMQKVDDGKPSVVMLLLMALRVMVIIINTVTTTPGATSDGKVGIMTSLGFRQVR